MPHKLESDRKAWRARYYAKNKKRLNAVQYRNRKAKLDGSPELQRLLWSCEYHKRKSSILPRMIAYNKRNRVKQRPNNRARMSRDRTRLAFHYLKLMIKRDGLECTQDNLNTYKLKCQLSRQKHSLRAMAAGTMLLNK